MKKTIRLTESELTKVIKKIVQEQVGSNQVPKEVMECANQVLSIKDMAKLMKCPTCVAIATQVMTTGQLPSDMGKGMKCAQELQPVLQENPMLIMSKLFDFGSCLVNKSGSSNKVSY